MRKTRGFLLAIIVAVIGAVGGRFYDDIKVWISPADAFSGDWVGISGSPDPKYPPSLESLSLRHRNGEISGSGSRGAKSWQYSGYRFGPGVVAAYRSTHDGGSGFGSLYVSDIKGDAVEYTGYLEGNFCPQHKIYRCPYLLVRGKRDTREVDSAIARNREFLSGPCVEIGEAACTK